MVCPYCNSENHSDAQVCFVCGARLRAAETRKRGISSLLRSRKEKTPDCASGQKTAPKARFSRKLLIPAAAGAVLLLALGISLWLLRPLPPAPGFTQPSVTWRVFTKNLPLDTVIVRDDQPMVNGPREGLHPWLMSLDNRTLCLRTESNQVYLLSDAGAQQIPGTILYTALSADGSALACIDHQSILWLYDRANPQGTQIAGQVLGASLAPDGSALAYYTWSEDGSYQVWLYTAGESTLLEEEMIPFALTAGGKVVYCTGSGNGGLYTVDAQGNSRRISSGLDPEAVLYLNNDHTQLQFRAGGQHYVLVNGTEKYKVSSGATFAMADPVNSTKTLRVEGGRSLITLLTATLSDRFYMEGDNLCYLDGNWEIQLVALGISSRSIRMTWDGKTLCYLSGGKLYRVEQEDYAASRCIASDVKDYGFTSEAKTFYFLDSRGAVWFLKSREMPRLVAEGIESISMTHDDHCLLLSRDWGDGGTLLASSGGSEAIPVLNNVQALTVTPTATYVSVGQNPESQLPDIYVCLTGTDFSCLVDAA